MLFDVGKYGENIAFEHAKGMAVTYNDLAKLTKRVEQKIGSRKLVCQSNHNLFANKAK